MATDKKKVSCGFCKFQASNNTGLTSHIRTLHVSEYFHMRKIRLDSIDDPSMKLMKWPLDYMEAMVIAKEKKGQQDKGKETAIHTTELLQEIVASHSSVPTSAKLLANLVSTLEGEIGGMEYEIKRLQLMTADLEDKKHKLAVLLSLLPVMNQVEPVETAELIELSEESHADIKEV